MPKEMLISVQLNIFFRSCPCRPVNVQHGEIDVGCICILGEHVEIDVDLICILGESWLILQWPSF